jgi:hypothetical protein
VRRAARVFFARKIVFHFFHDLQTKGNFFLFVHVDLLFGQKAEQTNKGDENRPQK